MRLAYLLLALVPTVALAGDGRSYNSEKSVAHDCAKDGTEVSVNVSGGTSVFTGSCDKISINGSGNKVTIATGNKIAINGARNKVTVAAGKKIAVNGANNTVTIDAADKIAATGIENTITWKRGLSGKQPKVTSPGIKNKISRAK